MSEREPELDRKKIIRKYMICFAVGAAITVLYMMTSGYQNAQDAADRYRILCDAFSIPGVLLFGSGLLTWAAGQGTFDGMSYSCGLFFKVINPFKKFEREEYHDYVERKRAGRRAKGSRLYLYVTGGVFLAVAGVFLLLFYAVGE